MRRIALLLILVVAAACGSDGDHAVPPSSGPGSTVAPIESTTTAPPMEPAATACERLLAPVVLGTVDSPDLDEISGVALSRDHDGVLWAHEDSGSGPVLWALSLEGRVLDRIEVAAAAVDWEDLAVGPGPGGDHVYIADTGDNDESRDAVALHRFPEPEVGAAAAAAETLVLTYPDGPRDVEAMLVDPVTGDLYLIAKEFGAEASLYRVPSGAWETGTVVADRVGSVPVCLLSPVTGADVSPDGSVVVVRTYRSVLLFTRTERAALHEAFAVPGCAGPVPPEVQGEAVAWAAGGYLTIAEGVSARIYSVSG